MGVRGRVDTDQIVDVEWAPQVDGVFEAGVRLLVDDRRGLLAHLATEIADAGANIEYLSMERPDGDRVVNIGVSIGINQPGVYGRIDIGNNDYGPPALVYPQPVIIAPPAVAAPVMLPADVTTI